MLILTAESGSCRHKKEVIMALHADGVYGACDYCLRARQTRKGYWYCTSNQEDYFPDAPWDGEDEYEPTSCPSFKPDPECYEDDDWVW